MGANFDEAGCVTLAHPIWGPRPMDMTSTSDVSRQAAPIPWQLRLSLVVLWPLAALLVYGLCLEVGQMFGDAAAVLSNKPPGLLSFKITLVLLVDSLFLGMGMLWMLGLVALSRGRPWGLLAGIANVAWTACFAIESKLALLWRSASPVSYPAFFIMLTLVLCLGALLLSKPARAYCAVAGWPLWKVASAGITAGVATFLSSLGLAFGLEGLAYWIKN